MNFHLIILSVILFVSSIDGLRYKIAILTSDLYFEQVNGKFKLFLHGTDFEDRIVLDKV